MKTYGIDYNRTEITPGILHFGVGNFHRAHQAYYTNMLLSEQDQKKWGICGAMILKKDEAVFHGLKKQDCQYGLTVCGRTGEEEHHLNGAIVKLLWGIEDAKAIIDQVADPDIKIITLTITEGGYNLNSKTREFDYLNTDITYDLQFPNVPRSAFGYIAAGLRKRIKTGAGPITILSCDNLPHNGDVCRDSMLAFFKKADKEIWEWAKEHVSFPNCMVDRITPATLPSDISRLKEMTGYEDEVPVYCEDFVQWVIEDTFIAGRPAWERVGVEFTDDVGEYESMKLGFVNSTHQMLSYPAFLAGYRKVDEAVSDKRITAYLTQYMKNDVTPYLVAPPNTDLYEYQGIFMERLGNKAVSDQLARLCFDGANKIPVYNKPTFSAMIEADSDMRRPAFFVAAYRQYLRNNKDEKGVSYEINDPGIGERDWQLIKDNDPAAFLELSCFSGISFSKSKGFLEAYARCCLDIEKKGVLETMQDLLE